MHYDSGEKDQNIRYDFVGEMAKSFSPPYTPEPNPITERVNRTLVDTARSMLI